MLNNQTDSFCLITTNNFQRNTC